MNLTADNVNIETSGAHGGTRFLNVTIPQGATINSATLEVYIATTSYDDPHIDIYGEDQDNAGVFTTAANNIQNRTRTTAKVDWDGTGIGTGWETLPDVATLIQEIVNRAGWSSGNALAILFDGMTSVALRFRQWDYSTHTLGAKLAIDYTPPATAAGLPVIPDQNVHSLIFGGVTVR